MSTSFQKDVNNASENHRYVLFTQIGQELATVCKAPPIEGFYEYVKNEWKQYLPKEDETEQSDASAA